MTIQFELNPYGYEGKNYEEYEKRRTAAGQKKSDYQLMLEESYWKRKSENKLKKWEKEVLKNE